MCLREDTGHCCACLVHSTCIRIWSLSTAILWPSASVARRFTSVSLSLALNSFSSSSFSALNLTHTVCEQCELRIQAHESHAHEQCIHTCAHLHRSGPWDPCPARATRLPCLASVVLRCESAPQSLVAASKIDHSSVSWWAFPVICMYACITNKSQNEITPFQTHARDNKPPVVLRFAKGHLMATQGCCTSLIECCTINHTWMCAIPERV